MTTMATMRTTNKTLFLCLLVLCLLSFQCSNNKSIIISEDIEIQAFYMGYACGINCAQHKIKSIKKEGNSSDLIDKDFRVIFEDETKARELSEKTAKCAICYDYYFTGDLKLKNGDSDYEMVVKSYRVELRPNCCEQ